ncbi:hypothetical protein HOY34_08675 [Xinfangfangia sp. D13-10-4-6]|uniref:hypothetical protein n=1 Tax=Pseudogemmobacter hezensis TaxID=2737662 RepID=UPI001552C4AB|nr:hypothetical protein [Pseudogemmobacter hezensis]NPD15272.1 hypothetical protein [Pseudogemmobacter hezensis]
MMRAEIEARERTIERDSGNYRCQPTDPIVRQPAPEHAADPVNLTKLSDDYIRARIQAGFMKDAGKRQKQVVANLRAFLRHNDARKVTKKDLLAWRDSLLPSLSAKTVNDAYRSNVRSLFQMGA